MFDAQEIKSQENEKEGDYKEITNYRQAIKLGKELLKSRPLSENFIKELHKVLLNSVRGQNKAPGEFRKIQVYIGAYGTSVEEALYIPPSAENIIPLFSNWEKYLNSDKEIDPLVQIAIAHYQFEAIHPFLDGNGRTGRILVPLFLFEKKVTTFPNIYVSEFLEEHRSTYYELLNAVSQKNEWITWIKFFLEAIYSQTKITLSRVEKIERLHRELNEKMTKINSIYASQFLDAIFIRPRFTSSTIKKECGIQNKQTTYNLIKKFLDFNIIKDLTPSKERDKIYSFNVLMDIIK